MNVKIIYRYIAGKFWMPFFFAMAMFCILVLLGDFFENVKIITNGYASFRLILKYCLLNLPGWLGMLIPVACLLAALFVISDLVAGGEWTACLASGYRPRQLFMPIIACVLLVVAVNSWLQEFVFPKVNQRAEEVYHKRLKGEKDFKPGIEQDVTLRIGDSEMLFAGKIQSNSIVITDVSFEKYNSAWEIERQVVAKSMVWDGNVDNWYFYNGVERTFANGIELKETPFEKLLSPLKIAPEDISVGSTEEKTYSIKQLLKKIDFLKRSGLVSYKETTNLHNKIAMPFMTVLMCLLGMPFAITVRKKGKIVNMIAAMVMSFTFWWVMTMAVTAGENGVLSPVVAGWGIVVLCAAAVLIEFRIMKV
ncbi:lipopolysaccharide export system permease protein [Elusimicrobium simillimum]|uniref:LptF/LptG family permease n=1 Tax=Elusimicrobium simillimum TaxID=3143438 RepID=UPI003C6F6868